MELTKKQGGAYFPSSPNSKVSLIFSHRIALWFLLFFVTTDGYGFRNGSWGGLGLGSIGWFGVLQFSLITIAIMVAPLTLYRLMIGAKSKLDFILVGTIVLVPLYMIVVGFVRIAYEGGFESGALIKNLFYLKALVPSIVIFYLVKNLDGVGLAINMVLINSLIASISILFIISFQLDTSVTKVSSSEDVSRLFRAIFPTALLVATGWILYFSRFLLRGNIKLLFFGTICFLATIVQMHRATILAVSVVLIIFAYRLIVDKGYKQKVQKIFIWLLIALSLLSFAFIITYNYEIVVGYIMSIFEEVVFVSGNGGHRISIIVNSFFYVISQTFGFGVGLDWEFVNDFAEYLESSFVAGPTFDSSYANIIVVTGLPGMIFYTWTFYQVKRFGCLQVKEEPYSNGKEFVYFIRPFLIYCLIVGFATDLILISSNAVVLSLVFVLAAKIRKLPRIY